jgi:hypothetical protein
MKVHDTKGQGTMLVRYEGETDPDALGRPLWKGPVFFFFFSVTVRC